MPRVRSTARVSREGDEAKVTKTAPILEVMRQSGLVVPEEAVAEGTSIAEAEQTIVEGGSENEDEEDYTILSPMKPSHIEFGKSTVMADAMVMMKKLGYIGEAEGKLVRFAGEEVIPEPKDDEIVVFKSFFRVGLRFPLHEMIGEVLKKFEIYFHQLTPNVIVRLSVYIWALRSQGMSPDAKAFFRVHELYYQTKAREMVFMRTSAATTFLSEGYKGPGSWLSYQVANQLEKRMVLHKGRREEKGEANDYGYESIKIELRDDKALLSDVAWLPMPGSQSRIQSGSSRNQHLRSSARVFGK
jgi:hypothetical protein